MTGSVALAITILLLYCGAIILIGVWAYKKRLPGAEDYFVASRTFGSLVMFCAVMYTIWSAFTFYGWAGDCYTHGIGLYPIASPGVVMHGIVLAVLGYRMWVVGKKYGYMTPGDLLYDRYPSKVYLVLIFIICFVFVLPYIGVQLIGAGIGLQALTQGQVSYLFGATLGAVVLFCYLFVGGQRASGWTNVFQGITFNIVLWALFFALLAKFPGGLTAMTAKALEVRPGTLGVPGPTGYYNWSMTLHQALSGALVITWPHVFQKTFTARDKKVFLFMVWAVPLLEFLFYIAPTLLGTSVVPAFLGGQLTKQAADEAVQRLALQYMPYWFAALIVCGVFGAMLSTADGQAMIISASFTRDLYLRLINPRASERLQEILGRALVSVGIFFSFLFAWWRPAGIVEMVAQFAYPGYVQFAPPLIAAFFWKRATKEGAVAGTIAGILAIAVMVFKIYKPPFGMTSLVFSLLCNVVVFVVVSLLTPPPSAEIVRKFYGKSAVFASTATSAVYTASVQPEARERRGGLPARLASLIALLHVRA